jgi:hypothetical protein
MHHTQATDMAINLIAVSLIWASFNIYNTTIAIKSGIMQYPRIDTDWRYDMFPPKILVLKVTTIAPTKTDEKSRVNCSESTLYIGYY